MFYKVPGKLNEGLTRNCEAGDAHFSLTPGERILPLAGATWKYATSVHTWYHHWRSPLKKLQKLMCQKYIQGKPQD